MNRNQLIGMLLTLGVLTGVVIHQKKDTNRDLEVGKSDKMLLAGIDLNAVNGLEVSLGTNGVHLVKKDGHWLAADLSDYPVDFDRLAQAVRAAANVKLGRPVRSGNMDEAEFGFGPESRRITFKTGSKTMATLEVGAQRAAANEADWSEQYFIRQAGDDAIYLADYNFRPFSAKEVDWIDQLLMDVHAQEIVSVQAGALQFKLEDNNWSLAGLDAEKEELQSAEANKSRSALQYVRCQTIADKHLSEAELGFDQPEKYVAETKDGFAYSVLLGAETAGDRYARFSVSYTRPAGPSDDASQTAKEAFNKSCNDNEAKAAKLNGRLTGWTYVISASKAAEMLPDREKLVKTKE